MPRKVLAGHQDHCLGYEAVRSTVKRALHDLEQRGYLKKIPAQAEWEQHLQPLYREIKGRVVCTKM